jgi:beta-phosphoglucomutase-like phosphatase (HAD superfamily)
MLAALKLPASACLALEDSNNGLRAATAAGLATVITTNPFTLHHDFTGALKVLPDLSMVNLARLRQWHAEFSR